MDLAIAVICGNCVLAIVILAIALWVMQFRRQVIALTQWCERWERDCQLGLDNAPASIATSRLQIAQLYQLYRQQLQTVDRIQSFRSFLGLLRVLLRR
jgi:hypothetical protein